VAAAVAGLAALGAVIATSARGGDDDADDAAAVEESAAFDLDTAARATAGGEEPAAPPPASTQSQTMLGTEAPAAAADAAGIDAATEEAAATTAAAAEASIVAPFDANTPIPNELELGRIGRQLLTELAEGSRVPMTGTPCDARIPDVVLLSDALLIVDGAALPVLVAGNPATDETFALDRDTCVVVATGL